MKVFESYISTVNELKILKLRLDYLISKQQELANRLLGVKSPSLEEMNNISNSNKDKVIEYLFEYEEKRQPNGKTLKEEIEELYRALKMAIANQVAMEEILKLLVPSSVEYNLFYLIAVKGEKISSAVEKVALKCHYTDRTVWNAYNNIKDDLEKLKIWKN